MFEFQAALKFTVEYILPFGGTLGGIIGGGWAVFQWGKQSQANKILHFERFIFEKYIYPQVLEPWVLSVDVYCDFLAKLDASTEDSNNLNIFQKKSYEAREKLVFIKFINDGIYTDSSNILDSMEEYAVENFYKQIQSDKNACKRINDETCTYLREHLVAFIACVTLIKNTFTARSLEKLKNKCCRKGH